MVKPSRALDASRARGTHSAVRYHCPVVGCGRWFRSKQGRTKHIRAVHTDCRVSHRHSRGSPELPSSPVHGPSVRPPSVGPLNSTNTTIHHPPLPNNTDEPRNALQTTPPHRSFEPSNYLDEEPEIRGATPYWGSRSSVNSDGVPSEVPVDHSHTDGSIPMTPESETRALPERDSSPPQIHPNVRLKTTKRYHPLINGEHHKTVHSWRLKIVTGIPCDKYGNALPPNTPPPRRHEGMSSDDWTPYRNHTEYQLADFLFRQTQMSANNIDELMDLWASTLLNYGDCPPFADHNDLYNTIDSTPLGDAPWQSFSTTYNGEKPTEDVPPWMDAEYHVWHRDPLTVVRNLLNNPDFDGEFDYAPYQETGPNGEQHFQDYFSGDWVWEQSVGGSYFSRDLVSPARIPQDKIAEDPVTHGSTFVPIILGSDKTTVSVATGQNEYYPLYASIGNIHNNVRRAHRNGLVIIGFLAIPKSELHVTYPLHYIDRCDFTANKKYKDDPRFRKFRRQLFHSSLSAILQPVKPAMTTPQVERYPDGHYRRTIFGLGAYIADYPEQVLLTCIVQNWCPK